MLKRAKTCLVVLFVFFSCSPMGCAGYSQYKQAALDANVEDLHKLQRFPIMREEVKQMLGVIHKIEDMDAGEKLRACRDISAKVLATFKRLSWSVEWRLRQIIRRANRLR